jgi:serine/threonine protein phosphatase 1
MASNPEPPPGSRIYAIGDIHGRLDLLETLQANIVEDLAQNPVSRAVLIYLGDYVDRGPSSSAVIDRLINQPLPGFEIIHLKGNHEDFLLRFHNDGELGENWLMNGGGATLESYGVKDATDTFNVIWHLPEFRSAFCDALPAEHLKFLNSLSLHHREGGYLFVHAGFRPGVPLEQQTPQDQMWIRDDFLFSDADFDALVVHGHSPRPAPVVRDNRIGIDTMAYRSGCLTCLILEGRERRFIST